METELIESFRKEKANYQRQLDCLQEKLLEASKSLQLIPELEHSLRMYKMEGEQEKTRQQGRVREAEDAFKRTVMDLENRNQQLKAEIQ